MDLKAHIQAARRAPSPTAPMPRPEIGGGALGGAPRRGVDFPEALSVAVAASAAALTLLCLAT